jgi:signal transduction histidine kinase
MRLGRANPGMVEQARTMMERQLHQMIRLVDDLLDVSRVSRGKIELRKERLDLATAIHNAIETAKPLIDQNGQSLVVDVPSASLPVEGDLTRLSQVFANVVNNAAKYTDKGGRIEILARANEGRVEVRVRDDGIGIPPPMLEQIFGIFTQVDRSLEKSRGRPGNRPQHREAPRADARRNHPRAKRGTGPWKRIHRDAAARRGGR